MKALYACTAVLIAACNQPDAAPQPSASAQAQTVASALALHDAAVTTTAAAMPMTVDPATQPTQPSSLVRLLGTPPLAAMGVEPLPVAGVPHLYHEGASAFFLDHPEVTLTPEQREKFGQLRDAASVSLATTQRKIDQVEQDLWQLTSSEKPDAARIDAKLAEIGRLTAQQRMDYVRAVGQCVAMLSDAQKQSLSATMASMPMQSGSSMTPMPSSSAMGMGMGMGGMKAGGGEMGMKKSGGMAAPSSSGMGMEPMDMDEMKKKKGMGGGMGGMPAPSSTGMGADAGMGGGGMGHM